MIMYDNKGFSQPPTVAGIPSGGNATTNYPDQEEPDYKTRFREEYRQLKERYEKLKTFNNKIEAAAHYNAIKEPEHNTPAYLLREQQASMGEYLHILEVRAVIEGIEL